MHGEIPGATHMIWATYGGDSVIYTIDNQGCKFCIFGQPGCEPKKSRSQKPKKKGKKMKKRTEKK